MQSTNVENGGREGVLLTCGIIGLVCGQQKLAPPKTSTPVN